MSFAGGDGSKENPYLIETREQFENMENHLHGNYFELIDDIDFSGKDHTPIGNDWSTDFFSSSFDGNGYSLKNIVITDTSNDVGSIFGYIRLKNDEKVLIKNLRADVELIFEGESYAFQAGLASEVLLEDNSEIIFKKCHIKCNFVDNGVAYYDYLDRFGAFIGWTEVYDNASFKAEDCSAEGYIFAFHATAGFGLVETFGEGSTARFERCISKVDIEIVYTRDWLGRYIGVFSAAHAWAEGSEIEFTDCAAVGKITENHNEEFSASVVGGFNGGISWGYWNAGPIIYNNCYSAVVMDLKDCSNLNSKFAPTGKEIGENDEIREFANDCYYNNEILPDEEFAGEKLGQPRDTASMTHPPNWNTTYIGWDFDDIWNISPQHNEGYPCFEGIDFFRAVDGYLLQFLEPPEVTIIPPRANRVIVKSPEGEGTAAVPGLSADLIIERVVEIENGGNEVCRRVAEKILERWKDERINVEGVVRLAVGLSFKEKVKIYIEESGLDGIYLPLKSIEHDVINQKTKVSCGDIILDDDELLARILGDRGG
ncbi:hypothetical protein [Halarsenatibacter silvermanii]|uniref:Right handed beta helix region n=1 Tax=Halarsenatibacter silvermanii TaxID=321763 RepID=A0A1G9RFW4_9FIRM|nr:hypothetical protein [Halarsenatibacter silvermanii]SDM21335.1 hypothetical protein SAMN04488692_12147 [Halarsenatibacter silvermanii]